MFSGVMALFERSLRVDARAWGPHLTRFVLLIAGYIAVFFSLRASLLVGAPGMHFFRSIAYLNLTFVTLLGSSFFSTPITEEREEDTLGLMLMAGISPLGILLGKSGSRLTQALLLMTVQYPFTLLAITMGGVTHLQIQATYVALFAFIVMLAGVGLLCSTLSNCNRTASFRLMLAIVIYSIVPILSYEVLSKTRMRGLSPIVMTILSWGSESSIFRQMGTVLTTGFGESIWSRQVISNIAIGIAGFLASWAMFGRVSREPTTEATAQGFVARINSSHRLFTAGRVRWDPFVWKDFYFCGGGILACVFRFWLWISLYYAIRSVVNYYSGPTAPTDHAITATYLILMVLAVAIDAGLVVSRSLQDEFQRQTLTTLIILPTSIGHILYGKLMGSSLRWLPTPICLYVGIRFLPYGEQCASDFFVRPEISLFFIGHLLLIPHAAAFWATFVRSGALPLGIVTTIASYIFLVLVLLSMSGREEPAIFAAFGTVVLVICGFIHRIIRNRAITVAARS